jgi:D-alanine-D-alanine ligase
VYTFTAKWHEASDEYLTSPLKAPVEIPADDFARLKAIAERSFRVLQCRDYARIDVRMGADGKFYVRMGADGKFYVLEMNPNPYLNSLALVNGLLAVGKTHEWLLVELTRAAIARGGKPVPLDGVRVPVGVVTGT